MAKEIELRKVPKYGREDGARGRPEDERCGGDGTTMDAAAQATFVKG